MKLLIVGMFLLSGCSTISGWFDSSEVKQARTECFNRIEVFTTVTEIKHPYKVGGLFQSGARGINSLAEKAKEEACKENYQWLSAIVIENANVQWDGGFGTWTYAVIKMVKYDWISTGN